VRRVPSGRRVPKAPLGLKGLQALLVLKDPLVRKVPPGPSGLRDSKAPRDLLGLKVSKGSQEQPVHRALKVLPDPSDR
jgi:hypothetical protein